MGPLSSTADLNAVMEQRRKNIKMLNDEARKQQIHKVKLAKDLAKVEQVDKLDISKTLTAVNAADKTAAPVKRAPLAAPSNPEAGPSDRVPALLTPGEAVIPAPVAQDPQYQPFIKALVDKGRMINDAAEKGMAALKGMIPGSSAPQEVPLGSGAANNAKEVYMGRKGQIDKAVDQSLGYADGTSKVKEPETMLDTFKRIWNAGDSTKKPDPRQAPLGTGLVDKAAKDVDAEKRKAKNDKAIDAAQGFADGTYRVSSKGKVKSPLAASPVGMSLQGFEEGSTGVGYTPGDRDSYENFMRPYATRVGERLGVDPSILIAQSGLETGWGKSVIGDNNFGNIKDFSGNPTSKVAHDKAEGSRDAYRSYNSPEDYWNDYAGLIERKYQGAVGAGSDATKFAEALKTGGYATDPDYVSKLVSSVRPATKTSAAAPDQVYRDDSRMQFWGKPNNTDTKPNDTKKPLFRVGYEEPAVPPPSVMYEGAEGSNAPAGEPPRPAAEPTPTVMWAGEATPRPTPSTTKPVVPKKEAPKVESPKPEPQLAPVIAAAVDSGNIDENYKLPLDVQERMSQLDKVMNDEQTITLIEQAQATGNTDKDWLTQTFGKIFGPTGLFDERELLKFAVLAAGGIATGASVGGSIRWAGVAAMNSAEHRFNSQQQAKAQAAQNTYTTKAEELRHRRNLSENQAKAIETRYDQLQNKYFELLPKATDAMKVKASELFTQAENAKTTREREVRIIQAIHYLGAEQAPTGQPRLDTYVNRHDGVPYEVSVQGNKLMVQVPGTNQWVDPVAAGMDLTPSSRWTDERREMVGKAEASILPKLQEMNSKGGKKIDPTFDEKAMASRFANEALQLRYTLGRNMNADDYAVAVENAIQGMAESGMSVKQINADGFRRYMQGEAVLASRRGSQLYTVKDDKGKSVRPHPEAVAAFSTKMEAELERVTKERGLNPAEKNLNRNKIIETYEAKFNKLEPTEKKAWEAMAKAMPGYSPFLLWVRQDGKR